MHYLYTVLGTTAAIVAAEIKFDYSLGDVLKDKFLEYIVGPIGRLFGSKKA